MRKLAANYVISESGELLKNGILIAEDDGEVLSYIDTRGDLNEMAQLTFHNGILMAGFTFVRVREAAPVSDSDNRFSTVVLADLEENNEVSILKWLEICKQIPAYFPDLMLTEIFRGISEILCAEGGFRKESGSGIYLLTGSDLVVLKLSANSRLKRII
jgi:hypothetical protein